MKLFNFAVVGCTGLVGRTLLRVLEEYHLPVGNLRLFASERSVGKQMPFCGEELMVERLSESSFVAEDIVFFCAGKDVSVRYAPMAVDAGAIVIDNSSCFRMERGVPLIVPQVNMHAFKRGQRLIANPNCSTIQAALPLNALAKSFGLKRVDFCTYQAVSGSGQKGINALKHTNSSVYPYDITKTCIPKIGDMLSDGFTEEERKMIAETKKILSLPSLKVSATCVRVPVESCHGVSVMAELDKPFDLEQAIYALKSQSGVRVVEGDELPVSILADGKDEVFVGRVRKDASGENGILFYCVADNVRKGAASNAVQIAEGLIRMGEIGRGCL